MTTQQLITSTRTPKQEKQIRRLLEDTKERVLLEVNMDKEASQRLIEHGGEFQAYVVAGFRRFTAKLPDYALAQSILGVDFVTPEEVAKARPGIVYTDEQTNALASTLPSDDMLRWCKDNGYAVVPAPPTALSLLDVRTLATGNFYSKTGGWYADQEFARKDKTTFGWLAIRKTLVPNSTSRTWSEQQQLLSALEHVPNVAEMSWFITTYFEVRGVRLFGSIYVRTSSVDSDGARVRVGYFGDRGLGVGGWDGVSRSSSIGVSSARK